MSISHSNATNFVPLLARLVLGAAFITAGWGKFETTSFSGDQLKALQDMGLVDASSNQEATILPASFSYQDADNEGQDSDTESDDEEAASDEEGQDTDAGGDDDEVVEQPDTGNGTSATGDASVQMKGLYNIAAMLNDTPLEPYAKYLAWGAAITELAGGILILVGFFSRLWGLGLTVVMATAFYLTSIEILSENSFNLLKLDMGGDYQQVFLQLSLLVLAFGVFLSGPGALSVDRLLFKGGNGNDHADIDLT